MSDEYKQLCYGFIQKLGILLYQMECDRCPSRIFGRNCCTGCILLKTKIKEFKVQVNNVKTEDIKKER